MTQNALPTVYNGTTQAISGLKNSKKRDSQALDSSTLPSSKRQRLAPGHEELDYIPNRHSTIASANDFYLDVRDGARSPQESISDLAFDMPQMERKHTKRRIIMPKSAIRKAGKSSDNLAAEILLKLACKYALPSTPPARIGLLEYQSTSSLANNLSIKGKNDLTNSGVGPSSTLVAGSIQEKAHSEYHQKEIRPTKLQPVEYAWIIRKSSSGEFARYSQQLRSTCHATGVAKKIQQEALRSELKALSKGLTSQSILNSGLFWPNRTIQKPLLAQNGIVTPLQPSPMIYSRIRIWEDRA